MPVRNRVTGRVFDRSGVGENQIMEAVCICDASVGG